MTQEPFLVNGRFLSQPVTGVQRFSVEIVGAIDTLIGLGEWPETALLTPQSSSTLSGQAVACGSRLRLRPVGRRQGHLWEQVDLPRAARGSTLINLGNTAPILAGAGQVVVIHDAGVFDTPSSYSWKFRLAYKSLQQALVKAGARIATVSEFSRRRIAACLDVDPEQIAVLYEGADHILRTPSDPHTLARYGLQPGGFALVVGSRVAHKNLEALGEVTAALERRGMVVAVAGGMNAIVFQAAPGPVGERQLGRITDAELRALYENACCLLFPSRYEGFGLPPVEAMVCGCPVIAGRGGAVEEICGAAALYFDADQPSSITRVIERLLDDGDLAADLRGQGIGRAATLSWIASARILGDVVRRAP